MSGAAAGGPTADVSVRVAWADDADAIAAVQVRAWPEMYAGLLPAHAFPTDDRWLARMADALAGDRVACASGEEHGPDGEPLHGPLLQDAALAERHFGWGYSNAAGGFRRALWAEHPFRPDMPGTEDKEWAWHWMRQGWRTCIDPALLVDHSHSDDPLPECVFTAARPYPPDAKPVFLGHYWLWGEHPVLLAPNVACLDYSVAKHGMLCAYRWSGEQKLTEKNFVTVPARSRVARGD